MGGAGCRGSLCETDQSSSSQLRSGFMHATRLDRTNELYRKPPPTGNFLSPSPARRGSVSPVREPQKATLRIRQSTRTSQTKLHICGKSASDPGEGIGQDLMNSRAGIRELYMEIRRERERNRVPELGGTEKSVDLFHTTPPPAAPRRPKRTLSLQTLAASPPLAPTAVHAPRSKLYAGN